MLKPGLVYQVSLASLILLKRKCIAVPEENLFHGRYWCSVAGNAQLLPVHLQLSKQQLKPKGKTIVDNWSNTVS